MPRLYCRRTLHVVALPHTTLTERDSSCAYSMKILKFVTMMRRQGCRVVLYGPDEIECEPDEHVVITTEADRLRWGYGGSTGYDTTEPFLWDTTAQHWQVANARAAAAVSERIQQRDYLCLVTSAQASIADAVAGPLWNNPLVVEWAVGYEGVDSRSHHAFESYAWMHHVYGIQRTANGHVFDQVIPNFFDASQFSIARRPSRDYLLYVGRVIQRKGPHIAGEIARHLGMPLVIAGPGGWWEDGELHAVDDVTVPGDVEYVGAVGYERRNELMRNAAATIVPTVYVEPFGGVAVEAMLAGCPVIASDWGSFPEIVTPDVGARFRTLRQGAEAFRAVQSLRRKDIRHAARARFSLEAVGPMFMRWFDQLDTLWGAGMYEW